MTELKPCPFCGGEARIYRWQYGEVTGRLVTKYCVECVECGTELPTKLCSECEADTIAAWDTRTEHCGYWMRHDDSDTWECPSCHACFDLDGGTPKAKYLNYCPVCGIKLTLPE